MLLRPFLLQRQIVLFQDWLLTPLLLLRNFRRLEQRVVDGRLVVPLQLRSSGWLFLGHLFFLGRLLHNALARPLRQGGLGLQPTDVFGLVFGVDERVVVETLSPAVHEDVQLPDRRLLAQPDLGVDWPFDHHFPHLALLDQPRLRLGLLGNDVQSRCGLRVLGLGGRGQVVGDGFEGLVLGRRVEGH